MLSDEAAADRFVRSGLLRRMLLGGIILLIVIGLGLLLGGGDEPDRVSTLTHKVRRGQLGITVTEEGQVESQANREIKCRVKGGSTILWVIEDGTEVKKDEELVRLDTSDIEESISQIGIETQNALANKITSEAEVEVAETSIVEYIEGIYHEEQKTIENEIYVAEDDLNKALLSFESAQRMVAKGVINPLQVKGEQVRVTAARNVLDLAKKKLVVLSKYTKEKTVKEMRATLRAAQARLASDTEALRLEETRLERAKKQLENCIIKAPADGVVLYPTVPAWRSQPDIEVGAAVHEQQTLLVMPDLDSLQVEVEIHETKVKLVKPEMEATVEIQDRRYSGHVVSVAGQASQTGWWDGNVRRFKTVIELHEHGGLKPGMSAEVEIRIAEHDNVLTIPLAAVVERSGRYHCWVQEGNSYHRQALEMGASNDQFMIVHSGLKSGQEVILNPRDLIEEARAEALRPVEQSPVEAVLPESTADDDSDQDAAPAVSVDSPRKNAAQRASVSASETG